MSNPFNPTSALGFLVTFLHAKVEPRRDERGASAVEWVVIAAIVVGIAVGVGLVLRNVLEGEAQTIGDRIGNANS